MHAVRSQLKHVCRVQCRRVSLTMPIKNGLLVTIEDR